MLLRAIIAVACFGFLSACDKKKEDGDSTYAKLSLDHAEATGLALAGGTYTPTVLGLQLIDVRIMTELDSTKNPAPVIWYNPECGSASTTETEIDGKTYEYTQSPGCDLDKLTTYFDFARPSAEVNAELNSQPNKVYPHTYKYVSISWCAGETPTDNVKFQADGMSEPGFVGSGGCGTMSAEAVPPIDVSEGESITVSLNYSLEGIVSEGSGNACVTLADGTTKRCISLPAFKPSATKS